MAGYRKGERMKVLVTGGSGNIGAYVLHLLRSTHDLSNLDIGPSKEFPDIPFLEVDLMDASRVRKVVKGFDAVVHLAAIPHPFNDPGEKVLSLNVTATYNLLEAARENGVPRIVYACSESASGLGIHNVEYKPEYIPIDEDHPSWPHESYSLSKYFGEEMCREYSRAYKMECVSLRYAWVWLDMFRENIEKIIARDPAVRGEKDWMGAYIFPEDVAQGIALSLDYQLKDREFPFEVFYLTAQDNFTGLDSLELMRKMFSEPPSTKKPEYFARDPRASLFDITKAREELGYRPQFTWQDLNSARRIKPGRRS